jgi:hypothetical protein
MTTKPPSTIERAGEATAKALVPGAIATAVGATSQPSTALVAGAVGFLLTEMLGFVRERNERRATSWYDGFRARFPEMSAEEVEHQLRENVGKAEVKSAIVDTLRRALDTVDDDVVPLLGRLCADYSELPNGRKRDAFFFGMARILAEATLEDVVGLARLARLASEMAQAWEHRAESALVHLRPDDALVRLYCGNEKSAEGTLPVSGDLRRMIYLCKAGGIAFEANVFGADYPRMMMIDVGLLPRLVALFGPVEGATG